MQKTVTLFTFIKEIFMENFSPVSLTVHVGSVAKKLPQSSNTSYVFKVSYTHQPCLVEVTNMNFHL